MLTGSPALWGLADTFGVVPAPPDERLARMLGKWWAEPRRFGCVSAKHEPCWTVVAPDLRIWCSSCAGERFAEERRCTYCGQPVRLRSAAVLVYEMKGNVRILGRAHNACTEGKEPR